MGDLSAMNPEIVDVVNFNSDASCLSSHNWIKFTSGGKRSVLFEWLSLYVSYGKKVVLGFPGGTIADVVGFNPECVDLINDHPEIFEIVYRPFSHDIPLLRTRRGFELNLQLGMNTIDREFDRVHPYYLPPEFMCNSTHVLLLSESGVKGTFINAERFDASTAREIPAVPYNVHGLLDSRLECIPFNSRWTQAYLDSIHWFTADPWNQFINGVSTWPQFAWRDGESSFLLFDTVRREEAWLSKEDSRVKRRFLSELPTEPVNFEPFRSGGCQVTYPIHSFSAWIREMKMYWYVYEVQKLEERLQELSAAQQWIWLQLIGSDILSSVEKKSPNVRARRKVDETEYVDYTIYRKGKEFEGEEYLYVLKCFDSQKIKSYCLDSASPHMLKLRNRMKYLSTLYAEHGQQLGGVSAERCPISRDVVQK